MKWNTTKNRTPKQTIINTLSKHWLIRVSLTPASALIIFFRLDEDGDCIKRSVHKLEEFDRTPRLDLETKDLHTKKRFSLPLYVHKEARRIVLEDEHVEAYLIEDLQARLFVFPTTKESAHV